MNGVRVVRATEPRAAALRSMCRGAGARSWSPDLVSRPNFDGLVLDSEGIGLTKAVFEIVWLHGLLSLSF